jgi:hypothetical protein
VFGVYVDEEYGNLTPVPFFGLSTGFFDGAHDIFTGISVAFHLRLDTSSPTDEIKTNQKPSVIE